MVSCKPDLRVPRVKLEVVLGEMGGDRASSWSKDRKLVPRERGWLEVVRIGTTGGLSRLYCRL